MYPARAVFRPRRSSGRKSRRNHLVVLKYEAGQMKCVDGDGLEVMRLYVEPGDAVTFRSEGRAWSVDFGKLSPFEVARIEGGPRDTVTVQVEEETFTGVEYRYFASLRDPQEGGLRVRIQPLIRVEAYAMPISW